ncbi:MAG: CapA family protein [Ignavibacteriales bacterium]|nr:CapA family protein [Ignavibacteriales bacterium]
MKKLAIPMLMWTMLCSAQRVDSLARVTLLAFGDVNLGRTVGQRILQGDVDYPFTRIRDTLSASDFVFVNLESQLSDQGGQTEDPTSNIVFCGPPVAAASLRRAHIGIVSTANNHAFDYGLKALRETISFLRTEGIESVGTSEDSTGVSSFAIVEKHHLRIGIAAYTQFVNGPVLWQGHISLFDSQRAKIEISNLKKQVDFVIASYHGGKEYVDAPDAQTQAEMRFLIDAGADVVIGHHSHVPQGIEGYGKGLIFHSLGNFVFLQSPYWTRRSYGVEFTIEKFIDRSTISAIRLVPVRAGYQPSLDLSKDEITKLIERVKSLSNVQIESRDNMFFVRAPSFTSRGE